MAPLPRQERTNGLESTRLDNPSQHKADVRLKPCTPSRYHHM